MIKVNLRQFREWAIRERSVDIPGGSLNPPGRLRGQCVSLIQQYVHRVFGIPFQARGHAFMWANNPLPNHFRRLLPTGNRPQPGDILVYSREWSRDEFGHVAMMDDQNWFLDQNGLQRNTTVRRATPLAGFHIILRPINQDRLGLANNNNNVQFGTRKL